MSSEIYELMKRPDELSVVEKAHANPRFVEDCVREMLRQVVEGYPDLPGEAFVMARQENLETIHRHNVVAERYGKLEDLRDELRGRRAGAPSPHEARVAGGSGDIGVSSAHGFGLRPSPYASVPTDDVGGRRSSRRR